MALYRLCTGVVKNVCSIEPILCVHSVNKSFGVIWYRLSTTSGKYIYMLNECVHIYDHCSKAYAPSVGYTGSIVDDLYGYI